METALQTMQSYDLASGSSMMTLGTQLADFIKTKNLSQQIQGREYVNVEGWQFAGGMLGIMPIITKVEDLSKEDEIIYQASCDLINIHTGAKVGGGFAMCSNKEKGKKYFEAYAIQSMAQTRSIGKAYRLMLGWLMKAAGYEATPSEEMDAVKEQENELKAAAIEYLQAENREQATTVWNKYPQYKKHPVFIKAAKAMGALYPKEEKPTIPQEIRATQEQQEELKRLVQEEVISPSEEEEVLAGLEQLTQLQAVDLLIKLKKMIVERKAVAA